jgi:hypothetical protein
MTDSTITPAALRTLADRLDHLVTGLSADEKALLGDVFALADDAVRMGRATHRCTVAPYTSALNDDDLEQASATGGPGPGAATAIRDLVDEAFYRGAVDVGHHGPLGAASAQARLH